VLSIFLGLAPGILHAESVSTISPLTTTVVNLYATLDVCENQLDFHIREESDGDPNVAAALDYMNVEAYRLRDLAEGSSERQSIDSLWKKRTAEVKQWNMLQLKITCQTILPLVKGIGIGLEWGKN
jgi:hypothetical protein